MLCLHAIGHGGRDFEALVELLPDYELIILDWPGQGQSPPDATGGAPTARRYADVAAAVLDFLGIRQVIVIGNSVGGAAAVELAAARPDLVEVLVLCDPGGLAPVDAFARFVIRRMVAFFDAGARRAFWFPRAFAAYYRIVLPAPAAAAQRQRIVAAGSETAAILRDAWFGFMSAEADIRAKLAKLAKLEVPILFAWSSDDRIVALSRSRAAVGQARRGTLKVFRGGHTAYLEAPAAFAASFRAYLNSVPPARG